MQIIGNNCFKFKVNVVDENNIDEDIEINWTAEIFCIHTDFLVSNKSNFNNNNSNNIEHYFINCDCGNNTYCKYKPNQNNQCNNNPCPKPCLTKKGGYGNLFG